MSRARDIANYGDGIDTASITSGTLADARIPNLATSKITSGTFADARIAQSNVTQHESAIDALGTVASGTFNGTIGLSASQPLGHFNYISQKTISGVQSFDIINGTDGFVINSTYTHYLFKLSNMGNSGTESSMEIYVGVSSGFRTTDYWRATTRSMYNGSNHQTSVGQSNDCLAATRFDLKGENVGADAELLLIYPGSGSINTTGDFQWRNAATDYAGRSRSVGRYRGSAEAHDRVQFNLTTSGAQINCLVTQFGIKYA